MAEDKLFATLDPTTRNCTLPGGQEILLTDTVGFINKLPHQLVDAFRSTLEEAKHADIILHMVDATSQDLELHMEVVYDTLKNLGIKNKPIITAFNKVDKLKTPIVGEGVREISNNDSEGSDIEPEMKFRDPAATRIVEISAKAGIGIDSLFDAIIEILKESRIYIEELIPYSDTARVNRIRKYGQIISEEYLEDGVLIKGYKPKQI